MSYIPVQDHPNLVRDSRTGAILNTDVAAKRATEKQREIPLRIESLETQMEQLSSKLDLIIAALQK